MSGATPLSTVGAGFLVEEGEAGLITIKSVCGRHYVCRRETPTWRQIVAEFSEIEHAAHFAAWLSGEKPIPDEQRANSLATAAQNAVLDANREGHRTESDDVWYRLKKAMLTVLKGGSTLF